MTGVEEPGGGGEGDEPDTDAERDVRDNELVAECVTRSLVTRGSAGAAEVLGLRVGIQAHVERAPEREETGAAEDDGEDFFSPSRATMRTSETPPPARSKRTTWAPGSSVTA